MTGFARFVVRDPQDRPSHPKVAFWRQRLADQPDSFLRVSFKRDRDGLVFRPARLFVHHQNPNGSDLVVPDGEPWHPDYNQDLIGLGARALSPSNEASRFAFMLRALLLEPQRRVGDGFYEVVLLELMQELADDTSVAAALNEIHLGNRHVEKGTSYQYCRGMIETALEQCAQMLTRSLNYSANEASEILGNAVGEYLDEHFHITNRKRLGF